MCIVKTAREYAIKLHDEVNHLYNGEPYAFHLQMVADTAKQFIYLIPKSKRDVVLAACWTHDVIEDCRQSYNDVLKATSKEIAEITYALTNEKGRNRKERANNIYYEGIRNTPYATFVKLCDRIANIRYSKRNNSRMFFVYQKEMDEFLTKLTCDDYDDIFLYLNNLILIHD